MSSRSREPITIGQRILIALIEIYRRTLAYFIGGGCRFYPSCSVYGRDAISQHGALRGAMLTGQRIARCHPWNPGGYDPVPERALGESR